MRTILEHIPQLATPLGKQALHGTKMGTVETIRDAAIVIDDDIITDVGTTKEICSSYKDAAMIRDLSGHAVVPGFVDSHTHFLFGGYRPEEFMMRLSGASYLAIHKAGGGIETTVQATRKLTEDEMLEEGRKRLQDAISMGVTTMEGKSGYGLDQDTELRMLRVMKKLNQEMPIDLAITYLGAHSIPVEYREDPDGYIMFMEKKMLPVIRKEHLAEFVDVFCEDGVFNTAQAEHLLASAKQQGFGIKIHADEIVSTGGAELAARLSCVSADHLLMISDQGIQDLKDSPTVATLLPCTAFCLAKPYAPARKLIDAGCAVALASDYNPGSCFTNSIPLLFALAVIHMHMTLPEALCALTLNGAAAIGRADTIGSIEPGKKADLVILEPDNYDFLIYNTAKNQVHEVIKDGRSVFTK